MSEQKSGILWTLNNYSPEEVELTRKLLSTASYGIFGYEIASTGTPHLQCYGFWKKERTLYSVNRILKRASKVQFANGSAEQNRTYCSKDDNFEEFGKISYQGERTDIEVFRDAIFSGLSEYELIMSFASMMAKYDRFYQRCRNIYLQKEVAKKNTPEITVLVGNPGTGKTRYIYDNNDHDEIYKLEIGDGSSGSLFWDGYNGQDVILIDDFHNNIKLDYMLRLLDRYPMRLQIKGGVTYRCASKIYITSNLTVDQWYPNCRDIHRRAIARRINNIIDLNTEDDIMNRLGSLCL